MRCLGLKSILLAAFLVLVGAAGPAFASRDYGPHYGYIENVEAERDDDGNGNDKLDEMVILQPPGPLVQEGTLNERLFNPKLTREFRDQYELKFGRTQAEQIINTPNPYTYFNDIYGFRGTPEELDAEKRRYGDFVLRRLLEYHIDNYAKDNPKLRPAWEAKERVKEFKVEVGQFRFDAQYSIAGNTFDLNMPNPYFPMMRFRLQMDPGAFGPAPINETIVSIGRPLTPSVFAESHYAAYDGTLAFILRKAFSPRLGGTLSESTFVTDHGTTIRESKYLAGLSYVF